MQTKKAQKAAEVLENKWQAYSAKVARLLGYLFGNIDRKALRAAFDANVTADAYAALLASQQPIGSALHPQKVEAVKSANAKALEVIERVSKALAENDWDINAAAPYPSSMRDSRNDYIAKKAKHDLYARLTETDSARTTSHRWNDPRFVKLSESAIARFIAHVEEDAAFQYDAFICKMVAKVGECVSASIEGSHVWAHSILSVTKAGGKVERWKTQQIVNYSKFGLPFLQWPSRLMK